VGSKAVAKVAEHSDFVTNLVHVTAEREFKKYAAELCTEISPSVFEQMAQANVSVIALAQEMGQKFPAYEPNPWTSYLFGLSEQHLLALLAEPLPNHVAVLQRHPQFRAQFIRDLRNLAGAAAQK
jgi:hypothetical protein